MKNESIGITYLNQYIKVKNQQTNLLNLMDVNMMSQNESRILNQQVVVDKNLNRLHQIEKIVENEYGTDVLTTMKTYTNDIYIGSENDVSVLENFDTLIDMSNQRILDFDNEVGKLSKIDDAKSL